ncbi:MAG: carboxymuconolactone decarboxylase family protein [Pseudomonadota bacterium]|nr:carboxymuconolactone decarboxylase family protein [Pseudomonadota bacterium]
MSLPHLPRVDEAHATGDTAALYERAHHKLGAGPLPAALRNLVGSPVLFRDMMLNLERVVTERPPLGRNERVLIGLGTAAAADAPDLARWLDGLAASFGVLDISRRAAVEVALACRTVNAYYRAKTLLDLPGTGMDPHANLRASPLMTGHLPKATVELLCTAVSVHLLCKSCTTAHARAALDAGATQPQIEEAIRIQAVIVGLVPLER